MYNRYEYPNIKGYYNGLENSLQQEITFDLKQLKGLVLDEIIVVDLELFLINNIVLILTHLDKLIANNQHTSSQLIRLKDVIRKDIVVLECNNELSYGSKRVFGEYMNYIYNVVDFMDKY